MNFEMRRSTSPPFMDNYKQSKEMTTECQTSVSGKEPVQTISYRPMDHTSLDQISGLVPSYGTNMVTGTIGALPATVTTTTTGYVNGGHSINYRPRREEPADRTSGLGVGDVDFDTKCTDAYANLDEVRDRDYHTTTESIYRGVPNRSKEQKQKAKTSCCFAGFVIFIFVFEVVILVLAVFNLVNGLEVGSLTKTLVTPATSSSPTSSPQMSVESLTAMVNNLSRQLDQVRGSLNQYSATHAHNINTISLNVGTLNQTVMNLTSSNSAPTLGPATVNISVPFTEGCVRRSKECSVTSTPMSTPEFYSCGTRPYSPSLEDSTYLAKVECSVDTDDQIFPVAASLANTDNGLSCQCHAIVIPNALQTTLRSFKCFFNYTICPESVQVPVPLL